jgi:hypothetical protein
MVKNVTVASWNIEIYFYSDNLKERVFERSGNGEPKQCIGITILSFLERRSQGHVEIVKI